MPDSWPDGLPPYEDFRDPDHGGSVDWRAWRRAVVEAAGRLADEEMGREKQPPEES